MATVSDLTGKMGGLKVSSPKTKQTKSPSPSKEMAGLKVSSPKTKQTKSPSPSKEMAGLKASSPETKQTKSPSPSKEMAGLKASSPETKQTKSPSPSKEMAGLKVSSPETKQTKSPKSGHVYLLNEEGTDKFKVGRSGDPEQRRDNLQTGNPNKLEITTTKEVSDMVGSEKRLLQEMKENFESTGGGKEWFKGDKEEARKVFDKVADSK